MKKNRIALLSLLFVLVVSCQNKEENQKKEIEKVLNTFYSNCDNFYEKTNDSLVSKVLLSEMEAIRKITKKDEERIKKSDSPTDKPIFLEGGIFTSMPEGYTKKTIKNIEIKDNTAEATIEFEYDATPVIKSEDIVILVNENGWKIDNVKYKKGNDDLHKKLNPKNFDSGSSSIDEVTNEKGEKLKLVYDEKGETIVIEFNGQKATLKREKLANGENYGDGTYDLWFKADNISLYKGDDEIFNNNITEKIDYEEAKNYFVKNDYPEKEIHFVKINNQTELNKIFGAATTLGKDGAPTKIDFTKNYAIGIIGKTNNYGNRLWLLGVLYNIDDSKGVHLTVDILPLEKGKKQTSSSRPSTIIILDKKHKDPIKLNVAK